MIAGLPRHEERSLTTGMRQLSEGEERIEAEGMGEA
jgi:hypothetical protein